MKLSYKSLSRIGGWIRIARRKVAAAGDRAWGWPPNPRWRRPVQAIMAGLIVAMVASPVISYLIDQQRYALAADTLDVIGPSNQGLASKLSYDDGQKAYQFNQAAVKSQASNPKALFKQQAGGAAKQDQNLYALTVPEDLSHGATYTDVNTQLSFSLVPDFTAEQGKRVGGRLVYPLSSGDQAVYTLKNNGLKEDIVVPDPQGDSLSFHYHLQLPDTLEARLIPGTGAIGIYSADPALFGNISYGSDMDQATVMKARTDGAKTNLVFAIPAPVIKQSGNSSSQAGSAHFVLSGSDLTVVANHLAKLSYPVSIDPSVVVTASSDFATGNNDGNISLATADQISRGGLTGGSVSGGWTRLCNTSSAPACGYTPRWQAAATVYNGYIYMAGGSDPGGQEFDYAHINSDGTIGSWVVITSGPNDFATGRIYPGLSAYDGYLYLYGGYNAGSTALSDVQYAPINTDGSPGIWQTSPNAMALGVCRFGYAVYNGYLYATGGANIASGGVCDNSSTPTTEVQYAPINADGSVGTWTASAHQFTTARMSHETVAYNGYLYVVSGTVTGSGGLTDTQYAPITSTGDVGAWITASPALSTPHYRFGMTAYNGYLYMGGGGGVNGVGSDTLYAQINADGSIGNWQATSSFYTDRSGDNMLAYNGYLYLINGNDGSNSKQGDTQYAKIDPAGITGAWASSANVPTAGRRGESLVAYNGYLYSIGGYSGGIFATDVLYASISNGAVGTWTATTVLPTYGRTASGAVAYNGTIYVLGGYGSNGGPPATQSSVAYATISTGGTLGAWTQTTANNLPTTNQALSAVAYNGYLYEIGGTSSTTDNYALLTSTGALSTNAGCGSVWCPTTALTSNRTGLGAVAYGGYMYIVGGGVTTVEYAAISSNGTLGPWSSSSGTNLPISRQYLAVVVANGYLYALGGYDGSTYRSDVIYAKIGLSGALASDAGCGAAWCTATSFATGRDWLSAAAYNGYLYMYGGTTTTSIGQDATTNDTDVQVVPINNGGSGTVDTWTPTISLSTYASSSSSVVYNGYIYEIGGDATGTAVATVYYIHINADGTLGANWTPTTSLPTAIYSATAVAYNGYLYSLGGFQPSCCGPPTTFATVYYIPINADGTLGSTWTPTTSLPAANYWATTVAYNGYLYEIGGTAGVTVVDYAPINSNGTIGTWTPTTSLPAASVNATSVAYNGYLYALGGSAGSTVDYAPINSNGTIGTWTPTTSLPGSFKRATVYDGYLYALGGSTVDYAPINSNGTIGNWTAISSLPAANSDDTSVLYNGYIYAIGGAGSSSAVDYAPINVIPRIGHYSKLIDLGSPTTLQTITYNGALPGGINAISYRSAVSGGSFGSLAGASTLTGSGGGGGTCSTGGTGTRYIWLSVTLDDSADATFPDSTGPYATLTDVTVNYLVNLSHPTPPVRLHGGKSFSNQSQLPLDTCGP